MSLVWRLRNPSKPLMRPAARVRLVRLFVERECLFVAVLGGVVLRQVIGDGPERTQRVGL